MFNSDSVTKRPVSMFMADIEANKKTLLKAGVCLLTGLVIVVERFWSEKLDEEKLRTANGKGVHN